MPLSPRLPPDEDARTPDPRSALARCLFGVPDAARLPDLRDLATAIVDLATLERRKVLLPLLAAPEEISLVRRDDRVLVSHYGTGSMPEVLLLDRSASLATVLRAAQDALDVEITSSRDPVARRLAERLRARAAEIELVADDREGAERTVRGGSLEPDGRAVTFGFEAQLLPPVPRAVDASSHADVHALLFPGTLWAHVRGRRLGLARGPIALPAMRMLVAAGALVDSWEHERPTHVRLAAGAFRIAVRTDARRRASLTLTSEEGTITAAELDTVEAVGSLLTLVSGLLRTLVSVDPAQRKNLRVRALRDEIRALKRRLRSRGRRAAFVNTDPDRLRLPLEGERVEVPPIAQASHGTRLRFAERWRIDLEELDAATTFLCGDRLVAANGKHVVALSRDEGEVLWARDGGGRTTFMAGTVLVRISAAGDVELCDVADGEAFASSRRGVLQGAAPTGITFTGGALPPTTVLTSGGRLVALDLRTAEPRWRYHAAGSGPCALTRAGRVLVVTNGDAYIHALDAASGEVAWRYTGDRRFVFSPVVVRDVVVAVAGERGRRSAVIGLDLYSGVELWQRAMDAPLGRGPRALGHLVGVPLGASHERTLTAFEPTTGEPRWTVADPGLGVGGEVLTLDGIFVTNGPDGIASGISLENGATVWSHRYADPLSDDVPRRLEPVLRGGALFIPAAGVHVVRPYDGAPVGDPLPCDLVPDLLRVDERGWVYVAEESGHLAALAPIPQLRLVQGASSKPSVVGGMAKAVTASAVRLAKVTPLRPAPRDALEP